MPKMAVALYTLIAGICLGLYLDDTLESLQPQESFYPMPFFGQQHELAMSGNQLATGSGELTWPNGNVYLGEFLQGQMHGQGTLTYANGDRYTGGFRYGELHGEGHWKAKNETLEYQGVWEHGQLVSAEGDLTIYSPEVITEHALYQQTVLLDQALASLQPGDEDQIDWFILAAGTYGSEEVFRREINYLQTGLPPGIRSAKHAVFLSNSRRSLDDRPLATLTSLEKSLQALAANMDTEQDILLLYLTSHGSKDHQLAIEQPGLDLPDLTPEQLRSMLDNSGIQWRVIIISACYSGGFIEPLLDDNTLVITAAAADKRSFGCSDNSDFTYFGQAFFKEALPTEKRFDSAFLKARQIIEEWESREGKDPSEPQMASGDKITQQLAKWRAQSQ